MSVDQHLIDNNYLLEKFPGKGGWTYAVIPEIPPNQHAHFGWVKVCGFVDSYELKAYKLMPMGNGQMFLPVKASIRKLIKKEAGDWIHVKLYADELPLEITEELMLCLEDEPEALLFFNGLSDDERKAYQDWVYDVKREETKVERIVKMIERLSRGVKFYD